MFWVVINGTTSTESFKNDMNITFFVLSHWNYTKAENIQMMSFWNEMSIVFHFFVIQRT